MPRGVPGSALPSSSRGGFVCLELSRAIQFSAGRWSVRIGAHVSAAGGIHRAVTRATAIGAECAQLFLGAPQRWSKVEYSDDEVAAFRRLAEDGHVGPNVVHAPYIVNLAASDERLRRRSISSLIDQMQWCDRLDIMGLVVHVGSAKGAPSHEEALNSVADAIEEILANSTTTAFLVENTAGMGASIGSSFADIGSILDRLGHDERVRLCLDTAHTFEAGYDITTSDGLDEVLQKCDRHVGLDRLAAVHANDSKTRFGSNVDRHENIGQGHLGEQALGYFMRHPAVAQTPFYLEVPGLAGHGPDRPNIDALRRLAGLAPARVRGSNET
ncbi:MAG: deoxyribonuclease IV [Chloroflexi bacterium]|nr:deoxyribonuclease IV [Chloroflexota bacterium]